jgi:hypothetical protein
MEHEFIDDMLERLLWREKFSFFDSFEQIIKERATQIVDLGRIENAYQLFRKKFPQVPENKFREYIKLSRPEDYEKCVRCFKWDKK